MFRNRGTFSKPKISKDGYSAPHYSDYWPKRRLIIVYDRKFFTLEVITGLIFVIIACVAFFYSYKMSFIDRIADIKSMFLIFQLVCVLVSIVLLILFSCISKNRESLIRNVIFVTIISILALMIQCGIKIFLDTKYNEKEFANMYEQYEENSEAENKKVIGVFTGIKTVKEAYIQENVNAYLNFRVKTVTYIVIYILEILIMCYLIYRLKRHDYKRDKLEKDDEILYDEEENVKL